MLLVSSLFAFQLHLGELEFDRVKILSGEIWRIWTCHLVHTNNPHIALNIVASLIIFVTFFRKIKLSDLLLLSFTFATLISLTLLFLYSSLSWYNGLSGLLHALVAYFLVCLAKDGDKIFWALFAILWLKVLAETVRSYFGYEFQIAGMNVINEVHLIGSFWGTVIAFVRVAKRQAKNKAEYKVVGAE